MKLLLCIVQKFEARLNYRVRKNIIKSSILQSSWLDLHHKALLGVCRSSNFFLGDFTLLVPQTTLF